MNNLSRNELIKALVKGLKLDDNIFNYQSVAEETEQIQEHQFMDFYKAVMSTNTFGNGLKAVIDVAERFKPVVQDNYMETKAKDLIAWCESANETIYLDAKESNRSFEEQLRGTKFPSLNDSDMAILNQVKPYCEYKRLISEINHYQDSKVQLKAFVDALKYQPTETLIGSVKNLRIER